jgi:long-chain acyl-CoA synthetase
MSTNTNAQITGLLARAYGHERAQANEPWLTQPLGGGRTATLTWKQAFDEARRMAAHLKSLALPPGSHIALLSKNTAWWKLADLAIWLSGHVSVPIYPTLAAATIEQILEHSEAKLIFIGKLDGWSAMKAGIPDSLPKIALPLAPTSDFPTWEEIVKKTEPLAGDIVRTDDEVATVVYTSGSTGQPKGVMLTFGALSATAKISQELLAISPRDRMLSYLPLAHVMERAVIECSTLYHGFQVFFAESLETFVEDIKRARPTIFVSVPRLWLKFQAGVLAKMPEKKLERLLKIPILGGVVKKKVLTGLGLDQVRVAITGSAPMPPLVLSWYRKLGLELLEAYGMTENFCISHISRPGRVRAGYVGEPWPGVEVRISAEGEVQMKCQSLLKGYYKAPDLTAELFTEDGFLRTGDRGEIDAERRLRITGRVKDLFKTSKGKYVAPVPIENQLFENEYVETGCVLGLGQPQPCALVSIAEVYRDRLGDPALRATITASLERTLADLNPRLDPHEQLAFIAVAKEPWTIDSGVLTPTMKVKRGEVEERYSPMLEAWYGSKARVLWEGVEASAERAAA